MGTTTAREARAEVARAAHPNDDRVVGLDNVRQNVAMLRTPDGHGRLELTKFHNPTAVTAEPKNAPVKEGDSMFKIKISLRRGLAVRIVRAVGDPDC